MKEHGVQKELLPLGFTFSFPLNQMGLTRGLLERWTKGFNCSGVVGEDVVRLLQEAIERRGVSYRYFKKFLAILISTTVAYYSMLFFLFRYINKTYEGGQQFLSNYFLGLYDLVSSRM